MTDGEDKDDDYVEYVAGLNYTFFDLAPDHIEQVNLILEYADEILVDEKQKGNRFIGTGEYVRSFRDMAIAKVIVRLSEETRFEAFAGYNLKEYDSYAGLKFVKKVFDDWELNLGADFFSGHDDSFLGRWSENDRVYI